MNSVDTVDDFCFSVDVAVVARELLGLRLASTPEPFGADSNRGGDVILVASSGQLDLKTAESARLTDG